MLATRARQGASGSTGVLTYANTLINTYGASEVWPLVDISSGTTINAFVNTARNGTLTGWDLQNTAGPVTGTLAPLSDTTDSGDIQTASHTSLFDGDTGSLFIWAKATDWTAGARVLFWMSVDGSTYVLLFRNGSNLVFHHRVGGTLKVITVASGDPTDWFSVGMSWDTSGGGELKAYQDGVQVGTTQTGLGTWSGSLAVTRIGTDGSNVWAGHMAYPCARYGNIWTAANMSGMHNDASTAGAD